MRKIIQEAEIWDQNEPKNCLPFGYPLFWINLIPQKFLNLTRSWNFGNRIFCVSNRTG